MTGKWYRVRFGSMATANGRHWLWHLGIPGEPERAQRIMWDCGREQAVAIAVSSLSLSRHETKVTRPLWGLFGECLWARRRPEPPERKWYQADIERVENGADVEWTWRVWVPGDFHRTGRIIGDCGLEKAIGIAEWELRKAGRECLVNRPMGGSCQLRLWVR